MELMIFNFTSFFSFLLMIDGGIHGPDERHTISPLLLALMATVADRQIFLDFSALLGFYSSANQAPRVYARAPESLCFILVGQRVP
jgi:hypothetical protein